MASFVSTIVRVPTTIPLTAEEVVVFVNVTFVVFTVETSSELSKFTSINSASGGKEDDPWLGNVPTTNGTDCEPNV